MDEINKQDKAFNRFSDGINENHERTHRRMNTYILKRMN